MDARSGQTCAQSQGEPSPPYKGSQTLGVRLESERVRTLEFDFGVQASDVPSGARNPCSRGFSTLSWPWGMRSHGLVELSSDFNTHSSHLRVS